MPVKILAPNTQNLGIEPYQLVPVSSRGLVGVDFREFVKRAGDELAHRARQLKLQPGERLLHLRGVGATEVTGPNRNGDGFRKKACRLFHHTFVKLGRFYRDHINKDPAISYGLIRDSLFQEKVGCIDLLSVLNETKEAAERNGGLVADREIEKLAAKKQIGISMACPRLGTLVKLKRGFRKVEDVVPGDEVLTHKGRYRKVTATLRRVKQQYVKIKLKYAGRQVLEFTPEHEFYVARWRDIPRTENGTAYGTAKDPTGFSETFRKKHRSQLHAHARWLPCGELARYDHVLMPIYRGDGSSTMTREEARVAGYYLAEGSITSDGYPVFTCGVNDDAVRELPDLTHKPVGVHGHSASEEALNVNVYDKPLGTRLAATVGRGVRNKVIPAEVYDAPSDVKLEFLAGWFNGDGWQDDKGLHWSTCSKELSIELQMLLASVGLPASVYRNDHTSDLPDRRRNGVGVEYSVNISNRYSPVFSTRSKAEVVEKQKERPSVFITGDYLAFPVQSVSFVEEEVDVCDLTVDEDESFTAFGFAVHNCRVPFDYCSSCGNAARHRGEYCDESTCDRGGLKNNLGKTAADGHILHADNREPRFFDISHVWRPADRVAYVLGEYTKAASEGRVKSGAEMAEECGISGNFPTHSNVPRVATQLRLLLKLAEAEGAVYPGRLNEDLAFSPTLKSAHEYNGFSKTADDRTALTTALAERKVCLPVREFAAWHTGQTLEKAGAVADSVVRALPGVYTRMMDAPDLDERLERNPYLVGARSSERARAFANKVASELSLEEPSLRRRIVLASLRNGEVPAVQKSLEKTASNSDADRLADAYALYKLAFLEYWDPILETTPMLKLAVRQNYFNSPLA